MKAQPIRTFETHCKGSLKEETDSHIKNTEKSQIKDLTLYLKLLEKQEKDEFKTSRSREIIKVRAKINKIDKKTPQKTTYKESTKDWFFEKIKKRLKNPWKLIKMRN
jgi:hypothetical protein